MVGLALHCTGIVLQMQSIWSYSILNTAIQASCDQESEAGYSGGRKGCMPMWSKATKGTLDTTNGKNDCVKCSKGSCSVGLKGRALYLQGCHHSGADLD